MWWLSLAFAYPEIRMAPSSPTLPKQYQEYIESKGEKYSPLSCTDFAEGMLLCFRYVDGEKLPYVQQQNLEQWDAKLEQIQTSAKDFAKQYVTSDRYTFQKIEGMDGGYWASAKKDGWDASGLFYPAQLQQMVGRKFLMAVPQAGMFLFWGQGNPAIDRVIAIGVKEIYKEAKQPVSPYIYEWGGEKWDVWGEAVESQK